MKVLVANVGSTSLKYRLYELPQETLLAEGRVENIGAPESSVKHKPAKGKTRQETCSGLTYGKAVQRIISTLTEPGLGPLGSLEELDAVAFKVVHAFRLSGCRRLTDEVLAAMEEYVPVAPLHNRVYLDAIRLFQRELPQVPMVGLFETDFHRTIPEKAYRYAIPQAWQEDYGIRRYGFHGASFRYLAERIPELARKPDEQLKVIACHLGGSSSVCALKGGKSLETSMGFSPQSGIPHATRVGELDSFAVLYLLRKGLTVEEMEQGLIRDGGLKGISGLSGDVPVLEKAAVEGHERAQLALEAFVHEVRKTIGAYTAVLQGLDALVFSGGIGERGARIRTRVCEGFGYLGLELDPEKNIAASGEARISAENSKIEVWVIPTNEERVVARETYRLLTNPESSGDERRSL